MKRIKPILFIIIALVIGFILRGCFTSPAAPEPQASSLQPKASLWTCSMHPQIQLPKPGKCPLCGMDLILLESGDSGGGEREISVSPYAAKLMELETSAVARHFVAADLRMIGKVDTDETRVDYISSWVPGRIDRLYVDYTGIAVKKGDHLAELYSPELLTAQEELIQAIQTLEKLKDSNSSMLLETAQQTITAAREKLRLWGFTTDQVAGIEKSGTPNDHMTIYSPGAGIVIHKNALEGMYVQTGTRLFTIADLSTVWVQLDAYESDLDWLRYGGNVDFTTEAYPGRIFKGTISFIDPVLSPATRTAKVRVIVENPTLALKPGMFVRAVARPLVAASGRVMNAALAGKWISPMHPEIVKDHPGTCDVCGMPLVPAESLGYVSEEPENAPLLIPVTAALKTGKRAIVYVQMPNTEKPTYEGREVLLGVRLGNFYVVERGLAAGERVVTRGAFKLDAELQIQAKPSMMTPEGGGGGGMAGMDMGEKPMASGEKEQPSGQSMQSLSMAVRMQMQAVQTAAQAALDALAGGKTRDARPLFQTLEEAVSAVEPTALPPSMQPLWKEAAMLLGNDAAEGKMIVTETDAATLGGQLGEHLQSFAKTMGLGEKPMAMAPAPQPLEVPAVFSEQLEAAVQGYFAIQQALGADDADASKTAAAAMQEKLGKVDMSLLNGDGHMVWMDHLKNLNTATIKLTKAATIEQQRAAFYPLSQQLTMTLKVFPIPTPVYQAFCPMAFGNAGAIWLQPGKEILNPYFGAAMPGCGEIQKTIGASK